MKRCSYDTENSQAGLPTGLSKPPPIVKPTYPAEPTALQAISKIGGRKPGDLYKFGRKEHLRRALALGAIRIAPASMYNDPSLNRAIRDDELSLSITMRPGQVRIRRPDSTIAPFGNIRINFAARTNFFVFCTASKYTLREYDDFEADSCLVIRDPRKLIRKMLAAVKRQHPEMDGFACPVTYVDPLNADPSQMEVMTCKHFRYAYQNEYRIVWVPRSPTKILVPFEIDIGDMSDYAHLIEIP